MIGVAVGVAVGVGRRLGVPQGLTGQLKISSEAVGATQYVVAACQPDVVGAVGVRREVAPRVGEGLAN